MCEYAARPHPITHATPPAALSHTQASIRNLQEDAGGVCVAAAAEAAQVLRNANCAGTVSLVYSPPAPPPPAPPSSPPMLCENTCTNPFGIDGAQLIDNDHCQDGHEAADGAVCDLGTDCNDCGPREYLPPPSSPPPRRHCRRRPRRLQPRRPCSARTRAASTRRDLEAPTPRTATAKMAATVPPEAAARTAPTARTAGHASRCRPLSRRRCRRPRPRRPTLSPGRSPRSLAAALLAPTTESARAPSSFIRLGSPSPRTAPSRSLPCVPGLRHTRRCAIPHTREPQTPSLCVR